MTRGNLHHEGKMVRDRGEGLMKRAEVEVTWTSERRRPLVAGKDKETDFPLEDSEEIQPCWRLYS